MIFVVEQTPLVFISFFPGYLFPHKVRGNSPTDVCQARSATAGVRVTKKPGEGISPTGADSDFK